MAKYTIKFNQPYTKLKDAAGYVKTARLLEVLFVSPELLSRQFLKYDTDESYPFGSGQHLLLLFQKPNGDLFTTIRSAFNGYGKQKSKADFYSDLRGEMFNIVITGHN